MEIRIGMSSITCLIPNPQSLIPDFPPCPTDALIAVRILKTPGCLALRRSRCCARGGRVLLVAGSRLRPRFVLETRGRPLQPGGPAADGGQPLLLLRGQCGAGGGNIKSAAEQLPGRRCGWTATTC